jgi:hypothetical protein
MSVSLIKERWCMTQLRLLHSYLVLVKSSLSHIICLNFLNQMKCFVACSSGLCNCDMTPLNGTRRKECKRLWQLNVHVDGKSLPCSVRDLLKLSLKNRLIFFERDFPLWYTLEGNECVVNLKNLHVISWSLLYLIIINCYSTYYTKMVVFEDTILTKILQSSGC